MRFHIPRTLFSVELAAVLVFSQSNGFIIISFQLKHDVSATFIADVVSIASQQLPLSAENNYV